MEMKLEGKVALVTAASKGLGKACALEFAREGAAVVICSRDLAAVEAVAAEIRAQTGAKVLAIQADLTSAQAIEQLMATATQAFGRIDTLVCNAGGPPAGGFEQISDEQWAGAVELTLLSVVRLIRAALPHLKASGAGRIVAVASNSVRQPLPGLILSNTLRAGLQGLIKSCADEFAPFNVLVNTVAPGRIETDRLRQVETAWADRAGISLAEQMAKTHREIPQGRYGTPEEFAKYAVFLGSPANTYVTGQALMVDGGMTRAL